MDGKGTMVGLFILLAGLLLVTGEAGAAALEEVPDFSPNPGELEMFRYVPDNLGPGRPLVLLLHGCGQKAADYDDETGWVAQAEAGRFALVLAQQGRANNLFACFNWFLAEDARRDRGEAASIMAMVKHMIADHRSDPSRVFVTGLSAGGAMTAVMLATYPEVFAGGAVLAGIPFGCAEGAVQGTVCMLTPKVHAPTVWGDQVRRASAHSGPWPVVSVWQGTHDKWVKAANALELAKQWTDVHGIDLVPDREEDLGGARRRAYADASGKVRVETVLIPGMDHGVPVAPERCGKAGPYILDIGLCASAAIARFWGLLRSGD